LDKKTVLTVSLLFFLALGLFSSCAQREDEGSIKAGVILPFSGELSTYGNECLKGIVLRLDEVNRDGGIRGRKLIYVTEDNLGDPLKTANTVDLLAKDDQVLAIIGAATSENTLAGASVAQHLKVPLLAPLATSPVVTEVGDYIFRICFVDPYQGGALANFAFSFLKLKKTAVLSREEDQYSEGLTEFFIKNYRRMGGEIVSHLYYAEGETDFVSLLNEIKDRQPEALFVPGYWNEAAAIFKQAKKLGLELFFLGGDVWDMMRPGCWSMP
jgi:branched-chain amino acid transport system substrate-binding protein